MKFFRLLKRWLNMLNGKSVFHVEQSEGKCYSKTEIKGYYNDLTNKVSDKTILDSEGIPINTTIANIEAYFPITIFQYGLGLYDLYILEGKVEYLKKFVNIANWAIENMEANGMWDCMGKVKDNVHFTQSSMCQSEGCSLLLRAFLETKDKKYYAAAKKAIDFMLIDVKNGGTTTYDCNKIIFQEYVSHDELSVLNGWIFSIFGLFDFSLITSEKKYKETLEKTLQTLKKMLDKYDKGYWSNYDLKGTIASPAYHDLHIKQLKLLYELFGIKEFKIYAEKWEKYQYRKFNKIRAMILKIKQKIIKNKYYDINTSLVK